MTVEHWLVTYTEELEDHQVAHQVLADAAKKLSEAGLPVDIRQSAPSLDAEPHLAVPDEWPPSRAWLEKARAEGEITDAQYRAMIRKAR